MKSTVYPDHPRASASFAYRHLLHWKRGDPALGSPACAAEAKAAAV